MALSGFALEIQIQYQPYPHIFALLGIKPHFIVSIDKTYLRKEVRSYEADEALVQQAKSGNSRAFKDIVEKHQSVISRVCVSMLGNTADAEDVGQETFIRFYKSLNQYKAESSLGTYLTRIAINLSLNELRRRKSKNWLVFKQQYENNAMLKDESLARDNNELVNMALMQLDSSYRSVIVLRHIEGYSTKETAQILELPQGTILSRLSRGQKKLQHIIKHLEK